MAAPLVRTLLRVFLLLPLCAGLAGCSQGSSEAKAQAAAGPPPVSVVPATKRVVQEFDEFTARLEAVDTVDVRARVAGTLDKVHFREGQKVKKGDVLFTIDPRPFALEVARTQARLAAARTQSGLASSELARAEKLLPMQAVSQQEVDQLRAAVRTDETAIQAAEAELNVAKLNLSFTHITSPIDGRISRAFVTAGNLVNAGEPVLTTIVSVERVYAYFDASEATYLKYVHAAREGSRPSSGETANPVLMGLSDEEGFPHQGRMDFVDNRLNPATGSMRVRAVFDNANAQFTPGLSARIKLIGSASHEATLVPERAISTDQTRKIVMVVGANNQVEPREVKTAALLDGMRVVTGVKAGEKIIVDGLQRAIPGAPVAPQLMQVDEKGMPVAAAPAPAPAPPPKEDAKPAEKS
ncbi:MAG: efflux RND transporter periplasmic adaptor subunit [Oxalobacteraceae bacterium]|nr:efflux RND transporter periplasmic adaptor subunit [Oxalobacteraceae bacterium]